MQGAALKHRPPPEARYREFAPGAKRHPRLKEWLGKLHENPDVFPTDEPEEELVRFFLAEVLKGGWSSDYDRRAHERAMEATTPVLSFPELGSFVDSLGHIARQPEYAQFWQDWTVERRG